MKYGKGGEEEKEWGMAILRESEQHMQKPWGKTERDTFKECFFLAVTPTGASGIRRPGEMGQGLHPVMLKNLHFI